MTTAYLIFISHTGKDRAWAEWARWHLHEAGYRTELDSIDWPAGTNFIAAMHQALTRNSPMLILLSAAYLDPGRYTTDEWTARLAQRRVDPNSRLIPLRVDNVDLNDGIWAPIVVPDLFNLHPRQAVEVLLDTVGNVIGPPASDANTRKAPLFPGRSAAADDTEAGPRPPGYLPNTWNLPRQNPAFIGRDEMLNRLHDALSGHQRVTVQALHGYGGVGKTHLALEYAYRFAGEYDLVWWIPAEQTELIGDHLTALATEMGLAPPGSATPDAVNKLRAYLRRHRRWLLIFDNADDRDQLVPWLPDGPGHLLVTSRSHVWTGVAHAIEVDVFSRAESITLLETQLPGIAPIDSDRLADALGDLPLALAQAAELLVETRLPADAYLAELDSHAAELLKDGQPPVGYPKTLAAAVALTANRLTSNSPAAAQLLALCAHLGPEPIPLDLFTGQPDLLSPPLAEVAQHEVAFRRTVAQVRGYGLARTTETDLILHRLTQAILRDTDPEAALHRDTVERLLIAATPADTKTPASWIRWGQLLPHILACEPVASPNRALRETANAGVWHLLARGDARSALPLARLLHDGWIERFGADDLTVLRSAHTLATIYQHLGAYEQAVSIGEENLNRSRQLYGEDHIVALQMAANQIHRLTLAGRPEQAVELGEATLTRCRLVLGDDHEFTLGSADNLAIAHGKLAAFDSARELAEDTLDRRRRASGDEHPFTLDSANYLAEILLRLGEAVQASELSEVTWARCRRVLGEDHAITLRAASILAQSSRQLGDTERARNLDEDTLERRRRTLGEEHPDTIESITGLAADADSVGRNANAGQPDEN